MKVDDPRASSNLSVTGRAAQAAQEASRAQDVSRNRSRSLFESRASDSVRLSGDLQLADAAVRAAAVAGDVRPEAVARARALLENGELGADPDRLADRLIESLSERSRVGRD